MFLKKPFLAFLIVFITSFLTIGGALFFEYGLNLTPCKLCLQQRYPYYLAMMIAWIMAYVSYKHHHPRLTHIILITLTVIFFISAIMGVYHAGVEWRLWAGPQDCGITTNINITQVNDFLKQLQQTRVVSCEDAAWRFLGVSLAGWNAVISLIIVMYLIVVMKFKALASTNHQ